MVGSVQGPEHVPAMRSVQGKERHQNKAASSGHIPVLNPLPSCGLEKKKSPGALSFKKT